MKILVINCGSSSLKYQLFDMENESVIAKGNVERIGSVATAEPAIFGFKNNRGAKIELNLPIKNHTEAFELVMKHMLDEQVGVIKSVDEITAIGHRVVHGGDIFTKTTLLDDEAIRRFPEVEPLDPLHNPAHLMGIKACKAVMPNTPAVIVLDTAFHQTMPEEAYMYAIPVEDYEQFKVRRYGFHGTSHYFVSREAAAYLGKNVEDLKIITCHIGSGSSICAVKYGKSVDTSMGLTSLEGIPMGTRSGDIDPAAVCYLMKMHGFTPDQMDSYLNKKSGILGMSGFTSDYRDIRASRKAHDNPRAELAHNVLCYRIKKYIGSYAAAMGGVDCIVWTAGLGEHAPEIRSQVLRDMEFMGIKVDEEKDATCTADDKGISDITGEGSKVKVLVVPTNEELVIARETKAMVENL